MYLSFYYGIKGEIVIVDSAFFSWRYTVPVEL